MSLAISAKSLTVTYDTKPVLWNVDAWVPSLSMTGIVGPNGAGKSTLIKAMLGLVPKLSGSVTFDAATCPRCDVAYVPQRSGVDWDFPTTVFDLVMMGTYGRMRWFQRPGIREKAATRRALRTVGLLEVAKRQIGQLSGGQQQRAFIARALVQRPAVFLLDEPFAGVDAKTEAALFELLQRLRLRGKTIVAVHHDLATVDRYFDHVMLLNREMIACGDVKSTFTQENVRRAYGAVAAAA